MGIVSLLTISVDGFIAGPGDAIDWAFAYGAATASADGTVRRIGAVLAGRRWKTYGRPSAGTRSTGPKAVRTTVASWASDSWRSMLAPAP
jgi:hypothetical protein